MYYPIESAASGGAISVAIDEGQEVRAAWAAYFREIQEELAEARAILDSARSTLQLSKDENGGVR